ncbi:hypothetical protein [Parageobacillus thermoglucosidasius]|uniref:hypothetical protein n=1 Tax=Parageobacillus thermoglucosidasius TaxID=1426 RepID=UPI000B56ED68|nr:hypothetical protein [Parageobacillus thermoglucosidasius]OUM88569.1 MAG: hypothetical protein BAA00_19075 [Parageobacillus thermoglucosidasius]
MEMKYGYVKGNLAMEMSTQDEEFRKKIEVFFQLWVDSVARILEEMEKIIKAMGEWIHANAPNPSSP